MTNSQKSIFQTIIDQAAREFSMLNVPKGALCVIPENFQQRIFRLLGGRVQRAFAKILTIEEATGSTAKGDIFAFVPNEADVVRSVCDVYKTYPNYNRTILIIPIYGRLSQIAVEESGIEKDIKVTEFHADLMCFENYEFLVPVPNCFRRIFAENNIDDLTTIARALVKIEMLNGVFQKIHTIGPMAARVKHILQEMKEQISTNAFIEAPTFSNLIIIDRTADLYTPLATQFTYEGILDESFSPPCNVLDLPESIKFPNRTITLSDDDGAFKEIRGMQLPVAVEKVSEEIAAIGKVKRSLKPGMDTNQFKIQAANAKRLSELKPLLTLHLDIMDYLVKLKANDPDFKKIIDFEYQTQLGLEIDPPMAQKYCIMDQNWDEAVREYCIQCLYQRGLQNKYLTNVRRLLIEKFGAQVLDDLDNLIRVNLLVAKIPAYRIFTAKLPTWEQTNKIFNLIASPTDEEDFGQFYDGGYVPLLCRIIESAIMGTMNRKKKAILDKNNTSYEPPVEEKSFFSRKSGIDKTVSQKICVFVIGGIVPTEAAIIRSMGIKLFQGAVEFYIGSTSILSGKRFIQEICPTIGKYMSQASK